MTLHSKQFMNVGLTYMSEWIRNHNLEIIQIIQENDIEKGVPETHF